MTQTPPQPTNLDQLPNQSRSPHGLPRPDRRDGGKIPVAARRLMGAGLELAGFALILGGTGYWMDGKMGWAIPYFGIAGVIFGFSLGMWRLVLIANSMNDDAPGHGGRQQ